MWPNSRRETLKLCSVSSSLADSATDHGPGRQFNGVSSGQKDSWLWLLQEVAQHFGSLAAALEKLTAREWLKVERSPEQRSKDDLFS
jgi:hypothetical protein